MQLAAKQLLHQAAHENGHGIDVATKSHNHPFDKPYDEGPS
jgi:hypothetical protein